MLGPRLQFVDRDYVLYKNKKYSYFGGTDYHRLSNNPEIIDAVIQAAKAYGISSTGSRATTGNHKIYGELEESVASFFDTEAAIVLGSGYLSNTALLEGIGDQGGDRFFIDQAAHSSLVMAVGLTRKPFHLYRHIDAEDARKVIGKFLKPGEIPFILTDGTFASRGEIPPLKEYVKIVSEYGGKILIDDSHAIATLGATGKGSWEQEGITREHILQTGTLSKGFGVFGGIIVCSKKLAGDIREKSGAFIGSTGPPLPLASAVIKSISILKKKPALIQNLQKRSLMFKTRLKEAGFELPISPSPIVSITHYDEKKNMRLKNLLLQNNIYPPFVNYPGSPAGGHFRFALTSNNTDRQIEQLLEVVINSL